MSKGLQIYANQASGGESTNGYIRKRKVSNSESIFLAGNAFFIMNRIFDPFIDLANFC